MSSPPDVLLPTGVVIPGWVQLPAVDPIDLEALTLQVVKKNVLEYECQVCGNRYRTDIAGLEPCCTGTNPQADEHPMEVMTLLEQERAATIIAFGE